MRKLAVVVVLTGIVVMLYPFADRLVSSYQEQNLLAEWDAARDNKSNPSANDKHNISENLRTSYAQLNRIFSAMPGTVNRQNESSEPGEMIGVIEIEKINLRLPILEGATLENMDVAAAHITGTAPFDAAAGNSAIAAHRSYTYGKQFNRLNDLEIGDQIVIETKDQTYSYTILKKSLVLPTDLSVLSGNQEKAIVTLITCHPMKNPTHRLIVQAERQ